MIKTVADLLTTIVEKNRPALDAEFVKHGPTVGDMYEGLTARLLNRALPFSGPDLDVVTGFAEGDNGALGPQMDCMVVVGKGREIPFTVHRVYPLDQVIAAVEVKKTLYAAEISDAYSKFQKLTQLRPKVAHVRQSVINQSFRSITKRAVPEHSEMMPEPWRSIHAALTLEAVLPARIVFGYHGYKSLTDFRKSISGDLLGRVGTRGTGPVSLPTAIVSDRFAVVKGDGIPYPYPIAEDMRWCVLASSSESPLQVVLEVLWSRLTARFGEIEGMFGEDLEWVQSDRLLDYKLHENALGWEVFSYADADMEAREHRSGTKTWVPTILAIDEFMVVNWLSKHDELDIDVPIPGVPATAFRTAVEGLVSKEVIGPDPSAPSKHRFLTRALVAGVTAGGEFFAAENVDGRLTRWLAKDVEARKRT